MVRILTLASGAGSNFQRLLEEHSHHPFDAQFVGLIVDRPNTGASSIAERNSVPVSMVEYAAFEERSHFEAALLQCIHSFEPDLIVGAGFMRILPEEIVHKFQNRIMNLHPSLLPAFPGLHPQRQALARGVKVSGCTVHFMDSGVDTGPIIAQSVVQIPEGCDEQTLTDLIRIEEHELLPRAVRMFCEDRLRVEQGIVNIRKSV
ncbi:MAG: phosphoribosylglycinamide formyltransferase [Leptospiraceae bacterium]|nr:phosphoribosylglycinamide formyltransferase [Leptospiraceae bacterium]